MKLSEIKSVSEGKIIYDNTKDQEVRISTDTRTIQKGDFYLPLKGANFNGEDYIEQAFDKGAVGAVCTSDCQTNHKDVLLIKTENTLETYLKLANFRRRKLNLKVVAVTGSSGKTTTKEIIASTLTQKFKTFKTPLNHNNEIGLCQTIFETPDDTEVLVLEMGMRGLGEIELLSKYAEPDITVISNVGTAHIGRLGSRENIAKAKCEIVKYQRGNLFIAHDNELIKNTVNFSGEKIYYSLKDAKFITKKSNYSKFEYKGNLYELNVGGDFNVENALAAINTAIGLGMNISEIQEGLKKYKPIEKRWEAVNIKGYQFINDSYNANPESMRAFIDTIFELYNNSVIVLGDMGELGENEIKYHAELGEYINTHKKLKKDSVILSIGKLSKHITDNIKNCFSLNFDKKEDTINYIKSNIKPQTTIFLKASRSMKFEDIINTF